MHLGLGGAGRGVAVGAEGDVWIHTRLVCEALVALPEWQALAAEDRDLVFAAALLHDVAKPLCTRVENGRVTSRGHSQRGAIEARRILWELGRMFCGGSRCAPWCGFTRFRSI